MILFLDIEHPKSLEDAQYRNERAITMEKRRQLFEDLGGQTCRTVHYRDFRAADLESADVSSLVTSGNRALWEDYDVPHEFKEFGKAVEQTSKPVLGICGGHQLIGMLQGGESAPLRSLAQGETDVYPDYAPGYLKEWGYYPIRFSPDPLFAGFEQQLVVTQRHFWHLVRLPESYRAIAWNENSRTQAMRHRDRAIYGVQFHPEFHDPEHADGKRLLENFFALS